MDDTVALIQDIAIQRSANRKPVIKLICAPDSLGIVYRFKLPAMPKPLIRRLENVQPV